MFYINSKNNQPKEITSFGKFEEKKIVTHFKKQKNHYWFQFVVLFCFVLPTNKECDQQQQQQQQQYTHKIKIKNESLRNV